MQSPVGATVVLGGKRYDYFAGCGYLGLQNHPDVVAAAQKALQEYGIGTATSRGGYGEHALYDELEREICAFFGSEKALYFASGYLGMALLVQGEGRANDHYFIDAGGHYSLWDAAQAANRPMTVYPHRNTERLGELLKSELQGGERPVVLSDGVFPVSGELAPVKEILKLVEEYGGMLYLDDAHAVGAIGENGRGTLDYFGIQSKCCRTTGTLSKGLGGWGGILWGEADWIKNIDRNARAMAGASPPPLPMAAACTAALRVARSQPELRQQLWENVRLAREGLNRLGWELEDSPVPIVCLGARDGINLAGLRDGLFERGIAVEVVRSYTSTPPGGAIRLAIFATHTRGQIERLVEAIGELV